MELSVNGREEEGTVVIVIICYLDLLPMQLVPMALNIITLTPGGRKGQIGDDGFGCDLVVDRSSIWTAVFTT